MRSIKREPDFVAWDGEGSGEGANHRYTLMCNSLGQYLENPEGITLHQFTNWLDSTYNSWAGAVNVGFAIGYDVNMLLVPGPEWTIEREDLEQLWQQGVMHVSNRGDSTIRRPGIEVRYRHHKQFSIAQYTEGERYSHHHHQMIPAKQWKMGPHGKMQPRMDWTWRWWDVHGFFQTSFVETCRKYLAPHQLAQLDFIEEQKKRRGTVSWDTVNDRDTVREYCMLECRYLVSIMHELYAQLDKAHIVPVRWDGAGAVAAAIYRKHRIKDHINDAIVEGHHTAIASAYAGGRIEAVRYGHYDGAVYCYDIVSAYPSAIATLKSQQTMTWERSRNLLPEGLYQVLWESPTEKPFYPLFWRAKDGRIYYPPSGTGWYYGHEVQAAIAGGAHVTILKGYRPILDLESEPFSFVPDLFEQRRKWKAEGEPAEKVLKLGLNSLYGKLAQHMGMGENTTPPYYSLYWAGLITSQIRAKLYRAALDNPEAIVYFATDGIASTAPLQGMEIGTGLGQWECTEHDGITIVQPGIYWLHNPDGTSISKFRGFDKGSLTHEKVRRGWEAGYSSIKVPSTRFIGLGSALAAKEYTKRWRQWITIERELSLYPTGKRAGRPRMGDTPSYGLIASQPVVPPLCTTDCSAPYTEAYTPPTIEGVSDATVYDEWAYGYD